MSALNYLVVMLENSQTEQLPVRIFLTHHILTGIVTNIYPSFVEIRTEDGKRCVVTLDKIEAIAGI